MRLNSDIKIKRVLVIALTTAYLSLIICSVYYLYTAPTVGASLSWNKALKHYQISSAEPWSQLKAGDVIIKINNLDADFLSLLKDNIHIESRSQLFSWFSIKRDVYRELSGSKVMFQVIRDGRLMAVPVMPQQAGISFLANVVFLHFITGSIFFLIGIIVFYNADAGSTTLVFLVMCIVMMLIFITNATSLMSEIVYYPSYLALMNLMNVICAPLGIVILNHFCLLLPQKRRFLERYAWLVPLYYFVCLALVASLHIPILNNLMALPAVGAIISIGYGYFYYREPINSQQMKWVAAGFLFGFGPWVLINAIPMLIFGKRLMDDTVLGFFLVFIPLSMAFAISKYRLMDIDAFLEGTFVYTITLILLGVGDFALIGMLGNHFKQIPSIGMFIFSLIITASLYIILRDRVRRLIRRIFGRIDVDQTEAMSLLYSESSVNSSENILNILVDVINKIFQPNKITIFTKKGQGDNSIFRLFEECSGVINLWEYQKFSSFLIEGYYVALVMIWHDETEFLLLIGRRQNKKFYSSKDLAILKTLLFQGEALYKNANLYEANMAEINARIAEEKRHMQEKEAILKDLHDGIGGIAANINLISENALASLSSDYAKKALSTIASLSKEGIFEVSTFLQSLDPSEANLETLISELHHLGAIMTANHNIQFHFKINGATEDVKLGSLFFLNILRIYREALTNSIKHSNAHNIMVKADVVNGLFRLSIEDDGTGLKENRRKGRGLNNIMVRVKDLGGTLSISSEEGVNIFLEVPLTPQPLNSGVIL
jgi:signal transduction histidine kinase